MDNTDVVIIGGGGCGLTLSSLLSNYGIDHVLFEQHSTTSRLPKAHYLNQRSMEIFRQHGLADEIVANGADGRSFSKVVWKSSIGGDKPTDRRLLASIDSFPGGDPANRDKPHGPMCSRNLPQIRLEPILRRLAEKKGESRVLFNHKVTDIAATDSEVVVKVTTSEGRERTIRAKYVVGADGGRFVGGNMGVQMKGIRNMYEVITVHFKADLSSIWDEDVFLANVVGENGEAGILPMGPTWSKHSEEWVIHMSHSKDDTSDISNERIQANIAAILSIAPEAIDIMMVSTWAPECVLADAYRKGRVFIAGDAAHRHPPTSGLGLNTAVADAHNIAWKLALVLKRGASDTILDSYEPERHASGRRNCDWSLMALSNRRVLATALTMAAKTEKLCVNELGLRSSQALLQKLLDTQKIEFSAHDLEMGHVYDKGLTVPDGTVVSELDPLGQTYYPSTRPGHRLPHCWLRTSTSSSVPTVSTHDLVGQSLQFVLITDSHGLLWQNAIKKLQSGHHDLVRVAVVLSQNVQSSNNPIEFIDTDGQWRKLSDLEQGGAILVRPDNYVVWRSIRPDEEAIASLLGFLEKTFGTQASCKL